MKLNNNQIKSLLSLGGDIAGAATGEAIGFLTGNVQGAAFGGAWGIIIARSISEIANRLLSNREKVRVGATADFALTKIKFRLDAGDSIRDDGFFDEKAQKRSDAEEIFEGVLLKAKNEHEEKKAKIFGNIFANIAFFPGFSVGEANHLLRIVENLTYRQTCLLSLIKRKKEIKGIQLKKDSYQADYEKGNVPSESMSLLQESYEMFTSGLIICQDESSESELVFFSLTEWLDVIPNGLLLNQMGKRYYKIMGLDEIPEEDIKEVASYLS